ncbi:TetR/AcrR family transcriptional regulator [Streptomyces yatensis]|uniref:HTH tetR-type domain-containing protein n=1 Tax=Streptomyces yatensis TaxID=155177 RepID=A0ABN2IGK3_9ACTN|nr:TetR/AcrR family transcriptional regulator [Streptomyces yatensis]
MTAREAAHGAAEGEGLPPSGPLAGGPPPEGLPSRADARRNRARVLAAARASFAAEGSMAPLGAIAERAGVGAGTVYRHFPSKEDLFEAVIADSVEGFVAEGRALAAAEDPGAAFFGFLERVVREASLNRALCESFAREAPGRSPDAAVGARREFGEVLSVLLQRAQEAGAARADVQAADVQALVAGCAAMEQGRGPGSGALTAVMCDGLRAEQAVTKIRNGIEEVGSGAAGPRDVIGRCEMCGGPLPGDRTSRAGRPARFCGAACRQKAHRRRTRASG